MQQPAILQLLSGANSLPQLGQIKNLITTLRSMQSPQAAMQHLMQQQAPGMAQALEYIKQHGNDPKAAFEALAKEKGINPAEIESLMR